MNYIFLHRNTVRSEYFKHAGSQLLDYYCFAIFQTIYKYNHIKSNLRCKYYSTWISITFLS